MGGMTSRVVIGKESEVYVCEKREERWEKVKQREDKKREQKKKLRVQHTEQMGSGND